MATLHASRWQHHAIVDGNTTLADGNTYTYASFKIEGLPFYMVLCGFSSLVLIGFIDTTKTKIKFNFLDIQCLEILKNILLKRFND